MQFIKPLFQAISTSGCIGILSFFTVSFCINNVCFI